MDQFPVRQHAKAQETHGMNAAQNHNRHDCRYCGHRRLHNILTVIQWPHYRGPGHVLKAVRFGGIYL